MHHNFTVITFVLFSAIVQISARVLTSRVEVNIRVRVKVTYLWASDAAGTRQSQAQP